MSLNRPSLAESCRFTRITTAIGQRYFHDHHRTRCARAALKVVVPMSLQMDLWRRHSKWRTDAPGAGSAMALGLGGSRLPEQVIHQHRIGQFQEAGKDVRLLAAEQLKAQLSTREALLSSTSNAPSCTAAAP